MFIEPMITWVPSGFSGYIWLDTKIVLKKKKIKYLMFVFRKYYSHAKDNLCKGCHENHQ